MLRSLLFLCLLINLLIVDAQDTLTVMHYNLLNFGSFTNNCTISNNDPADKVTWLKEVIDYTEPDILSVNEISPNTYYHQLLLDEALNTSGRNYYEKTGTTNYNNSNIVNLLYYNSTRLGLVGQDAIVTAVRDINVYKLYYKQGHEDLFLYCIVAHLKAGSEDNDATLRAEMTADVMEYIVNHQITDPCLFMGDFNLQNSSEQAWLNLTQNPQTTYNFSDPAGMTGNWHNNLAFANVHSQSTHTTSDGCAVIGGMDDRFDFILANETLSNPESAITLINSSYETLGQDGQRLNGSLIDPPNSSAPSNIINALYNMSDHLPVFIDLIVETETPLTCSDLFFSEYVEGSGNNKALEIFNPTDANVDLAGYRLARYANGNFNPDFIALDGMLQPKQAYVVVLDKRDPNGTGFETPVDSALMVKADTFLCPVYEVNKTMYFNGDDAMALEKINGDLVDIVGKIGEDPGSGWTDDADCTAAPFTDACGATAWTANHTLVRKYLVENGIKYNPQYFDVAIQWDSLPANTFDSLGFHSGSCASVLPPNWNYTVTSSAHFFSIPLDVNPTFDNSDLPPGSYIGAFFLDGQMEKCGGNKIWDGDAGTAVPAYGNDFLTPEKDGFASGENIIWKVFLPETGQEYYALAEYDQALPHHDGKFYAFGLTVITSLDAYPEEQQTIPIVSGWSAISSYIQPKWKSIQNVFGSDFQQIIYLSNGIENYYPGESVFELKDIELNTAYLVKSQGSFELEMDGVSDHQQLIQLNAGWNFLPVLSTCSITPFDVLIALGDALVQIKEVAGNKVYWPAKEVGTLDELKPGSAYFILLTEDREFYFEDCE